MKNQGSFEAWMRHVDAYIADNLGGLTSEDLPDCRYGEWHQNGVAATVAGKRAMRLGGAS